jgi:hypothetical protein
MKLKPAFLPDHIIELMTPEDRKALGRKVMTVKEAGEKQARGHELQHHKDLVQWLTLNGWLYVHSRTDKRTTTAKGVPDFIIFYAGKVLCVELKAPGRYLTKEQEAWRHECRNAGHEYLVSYSLIASITLIKGFFE